MHDATGRQSKATMDSGCGLATWLVGFYKYIPSHQPWEFQRKTPNSTCVTGTEYTLVCQVLATYKEGGRSMQLPFFLDAVTLWWLVGRHAAALGGSNAD